MTDAFSLIERNEIARLVDLIKNDKNVLSERDEAGKPLLTAIAERGSTELVESVLPFVSSDFVVEERHNPVLAAISAKRLESALILAKSGSFDLSVKDKSGDNLLAMAVYFGDDSLADFLYANGNSPFNLNSNGKTPMELSIERDRRNCFENFQRHPLFSDNYSESWLNKALRFGDAGMFKTLYPHSSQSPDAILNLAMEAGNVQAASFIMETGDVIPGHSQTWDLIKLACAAYSSEADSKAALAIADYLFECGVPFHKFVNSDGQSAWMLAIDNGNDAVFEKLYEKNETINVIDAYGNTPLFYAIDSGNIEFVKKIISKKPNLAHVDSMGNTALIKAVAKGAEEIVKAILTERNPCIDDVNKQGETALSLAIKKRKFDIVADLLWSGAEISKNPAVFYEDASEYGFDESGQFVKTIDLLDEKTIGDFKSLSALGFNLNQTNSDGDTLLGKFVKDNHLSNFALIIKCGVKGDSKDSNGESVALSAAKQNDDVYLLEILKKFPHIDLNEANNDGETIYDVVAASGSLQKAKAVLEYDDASCENVRKLIPIVAMDGDLIEMSQSVANFKEALIDFVDDNGNDLGMLCAIGENWRNFRALKKFDYSADSNRRNKSGRDLSSLVESISPESKSLYYDRLIEYSSIKGKPYPK